MCGCLLCMGGSSENVTSNPSIVYHQLSHTRFQTKQTVELVILHPGANTRMSFFFFSEGHMAQEVEGC